uniref:Uncharacterized protein n=1 Tax=Paramormyrops kingsleyae TaxID=1676925 RepID=A0A3B3QC25_9TELE
MYSTVCAKHIGLKIKSKGALSGSLICLTCTCGEGTLMKIKGPQGVKQKAWCHKIMVWGCFSYYGVGPIYHITGMMDQFDYIRILNDNVAIYRQQDNDPKQMSVRQPQYCAGHF